MFWKIVNETFCYLDYIGLEIINTINFFSTTLAAKSLLLGHTVIVGPRPAQIPQFLKLALIELDYTLLIISYGETKTVKPRLQREPQKGKNKSNQLKIFKKNLNILSSTLL